MSAARETGCPCLSSPITDRVTQFIKRQKLPDKEHLVCGTWTGDLAISPCSPLQRPMYRHLPQSPPFLPSSCEGGLLCYSSPHRGPSKPRRSVTSYPSSPKDSPNGTLHPFHSEASFSCSTPDSWPAWKLQRAPALARSTRHYNQSPPALQKI